MPRLRVPLTKEMTINHFSSKDKAKVITPKDPIIVTFRQATEAENIYRQQLLSTPIVREWVPPSTIVKSTDDNPRFQEQVKLTPFSYRMAVDCFLTMIACNIETPSGDLLFDMTKGKTAYDHYSGISDFLKRWGTLYPEWADLIYAKCVEVNPSWSLQELEGNEDEEENTLSLGEEEPADESKKGT